MTDSTFAMTDSPNSPRRCAFWKRALIALLKLAIAVLGIGFVLWQVSWYDQAIIPQGTEILGVKFLEDTPVMVLGREPPPASRPAVRGNLRALPPAEESDHDLLRVRFPDMPVHLLVEEKDVHVVIAEHTPVPGLHKELGIAHESPPLPPLPLYIFKEVKGKRVVAGLRSPLIAASSRWYLLVAAWSILVVPFLVSAVRWRALMRPQGIVLPLGKCLQLTFVGQFYSIMLPGVTGGDLVKIIYAARLTGSKTKSIVTILLDRVVGLIALMVIAGVAAGLQLVHNRREAAGGAAMPADATLRNVLILIVVILAGMAVFAMIYFSRRLRSLTRLQRLIDHPRVPEFVKHADEVLHRYRGHSGLMAWAFVISLFSQLMLPLSAWLSGLAFGMHVNVGYYLAYVPIAVLASSLPISPPQGVGVMDFILVHFFARRGGAAVGSVFALTQAIRFLPILWNLVGAYWVIRGRFSRHEVPEGIEVT